MNRLAVLAVLVATFALPVNAQKKKAAKDKPQPDQTVVYKSVGEVDLELHLFEPPKASDPTPRAAIVFFFGGGWVGGSPSQFYGQSRALADRGMVAICAQYRVKKQHGTSPKECVADGKSAIRWVRAHADELNIDPQRIAAGGGSAGGHVAAATATVDQFDDPADDLAVSCRPNALVLFNPVYDNGPQGYGYDRVSEFYEAISPLHNLDADVPPTIVFLGTKDKLIPVETGEAFRDKLTELGVRNELHLYDGAPHGFFNSGDAYEDTLAKASEFLGSLGYLEN
ncbi:alpha/beta hydrolase [Rhodopirellula sp. MGV]|uniref:alpha/beta hydrolase n=1 Tax=Rhodopirellula sp. MGV TaxID=2023130 RepID=UPI000B969964|nr:alpha/beta hydrolase [Rhodopirellula sp. MGV]OYP34595.1 peptidase S9 [Rhodopirellula sp. MGV]PNY37323.1 alpha/beta hydrolase [Rhodopirellula baltica]